MKKRITFSLFILAFSFALASHAASVSWASVNTTGATGDTSPSLENAANYSAYYITTTVAQDLFSSTSVETITASLQSNYVTGKSGVAENGTALTSATYGLGQYSFTEYAASAVSGKDYLAILFYENGDNPEFRVFGADNMETVGTSVVFDDSTSVGTVSAWTTAAVPEPTSGLLMLVGGALLALRRKRA